MDKRLMTLTGGDRLRCISKNEKHGIEIGEVLTFLWYDDSFVPQNNYGSIMTWYPDKPIWTSEEYDSIRYKFMKVKLNGISGSCWLKDFEMA